MRKPRLAEHITFEDDNLLIINKPAGISTLADRSAPTNMLSWVQQHYPEATNCHRLDKDTSGILIFARNAESYKAISLQFQNRLIQKTYHAIVHGSTNFKETMVDVPLLSKGSGNVVWDTRYGKPSSTTITTIKKFRYCSLVECKPKTGRKHQIRVHLKYVGHPIVADAAYGGDFLFLSQMKKNYHQSGQGSKPMISRMALHALSVQFRLNTGQPHQHEAPYPKDFQVLLKLLEKYG
jgi:23S rRNA pseudouridine955/2504/2580 synthase